MCGRYTLTKSIKTIESHFKPVLMNLKYSPSFNIAPSHTSVVITQLNKMIGMKWGFIPSWARAPKVGQKLINARAETLSEKPSFRDSFKNQRCLVPADGFIEWKEKRPYYIRLKNSRLFAFAGIWSKWDSGGEPFNTFTIITTKANETLSTLHSRMPVIVHPKNYKKWFLDDSNSLTSLFTTNPETDLEFFEISTAINSPKNNEVSLLKPSGQKSFTF